MRSTPFFVVEHIPNAIDDFSVVRVLFRRNNLPLTVYANLNAAGVFGRVPHRGERFLIEHLECALGERETARMGVFDDVFIR